MCDPAWLLVLNTRNLKSSPIPLIIDGQSNSKEIKFTYGDETEAHGSCSIVWQTKMYMFGGYKYSKQISVVDKCQLKRVGDLLFYMFYGACAQRDNNQVLICFENFQNSETGKNCHSSTGPLKKFTKLPDSNFDHLNSRIAVTSSKLFRC